MLDPGEKVSRNATMNPEVGVSTSKRSGQDGAFHCDSLQAQGGYHFCSDAGSGQGAGDL